MWEEKTLAGAITAAHASWFIFPQSSFCHTKTDALCSCLRSYLQKGLRESQSGTGWGQAHNQKEGQSRGDQARAQTPPAQTTMLDTHPFSLNTTVSILTLPFCTKGVVRVTTGNVVILSAALRATLGTAVCSAPHCTPWCAALHSPSSCNTCFPSGCFISLDQK